MKTVIIDVRSPEEFASDHFDGAINIPLEKLMQRNSELSDINADTPIVLYCRTGARSEAAVELLKRQGFTNLSNGINKRNLEQMLNTA